jgi:hypothetical protein
MICLSQERFKSVWIGFLKLIRQSIVLGSDSVYALVCKLRR